jgi:nucleoside-diphosphate-sugar epimerase
MLTGATGFIGSHIAERLIQKKITTHLFVLRRNSLIDSFEKMGAIIYVAQHSNTKILKKSVKDADVIIHCAGATKALKEADYIEANVEFTSSILNLINKQQRFIFLSSQAASGPSNSFIPTDEETKPNPVSYYGKSKLLAESRVKEWGKENDNNFVVLRPCVVYGPREKDVLNYFKMVKKGTLFLFGNGKKKFSIIHVEDLVNAVMTCAEHSSRGETYFVSNDEAYSWEELGLSIKKALNRTHLFELKMPEVMAYLAACLSDALSFITKKPSIINRQKIIEAKQSAWLCSNRKIKKRLLWEPKISFRNGIKQTADWYIMKNWI